MKFVPENYAGLRIKENKNEKSNDTDRACGILFFSTLVIAGEKNTAVQKKETREITVMESADLARQISYALGYDIFENVNRYMELDLESFIKGVNDNRAGDPRWKKSSFARCFWPISGLPGKNRPKRWKRRLKPVGQKGQSF